MAVGANPAPKPTDTKLHITPVGLALPARSYPKPVVHRFARIADSASVHCGCLAKIPSGLELDAQSVNPIGAAHLPGGYSLPPLATAHEPDQAAAVIMLGIGLMELVIIVGIIIVQSTW